MDPKGSPKSQLQHQDQQARAGDYEIAKLCDVYVHGLVRLSPLPTMKSLRLWFRAQRWAMGFISLCSIAREPTETGAGKDQGRAARNAAEVVRNTQPQPERLPKAKKGRGTG